jgi:protein TonB
MRARLIRYLPIVIGILLTVAVIYFSIMLLTSSGEAEVSRKQTVQKVTLLTPPPPPPPPPKVEQPPEPEVQEEVQIDEPLEDVPDLPDAPPMGDLLGLDADGSGAGDGFGLIGRKGGRSLLDGDPHMQYASKLQKSIEELLLENEKLRVKAYSVVAQLWVGEDGSIVSAKLARSTGDEEIDDSLVEMLTSMTMLAQSPPDDMPQPIKLRISSRM